MLSSADAFADGHLAALDKQVTLTTEQKPKVRAVFLQEANELFAVFGDKSTTQEQKQRASSSFTSPRATKSGGCSRRSSASL